MSTSTTLSLKAGDRASLNDLNPEILYPAGATGGVTIYMHRDRAERIAWLESLIAAAQEGIEDAGGTVEPEPVDTRDVVRVKGDAVYRWELQKANGTLIEIGPWDVSRGDAVHAARTVFAGRPNTRLDLGDES